MARKILVRKGLKEFLTISVEKELKKNLPTPLRAHTGRPGS